MKKILILSFLLSYAHFTNAQNASEIVSPNIDTTTVGVKAGSVEERLNKQEQQFQALKKENEVLKKQVKQIRSSLNYTNRKVTVSRTGSKQIIFE
jgi:septal ring factor EnvC (AmiA/AmiB activator)